ncbi:universal stress protein [Pedobacter mucosus]|uniref:universal stress protein n=1 Tax=Pedobacter mucosus TaxID=2895286 RepID=UPI001EE4CB7B|nr:universal stress protein [Pedobacter mucosus]UKT64746.1 universal stress protein [Pedobacter mucosus]
MEKYYGFAALNIEKMKNLLVLTDFSSLAKHAAEYAYSLAKKINADIILCNAVIVPAEMPQAGLVVWPMEESSVLEEESTGELEKLKEHLKKADPTHDKKPQIGIMNQSGYLQDVVGGLIADELIDFVVMGTHGDGVGGFLLGNHTRNMIESLSVPLLLVPSKVSIAPFKNIYFASDLSDPHGDSVFLKQLISLASAFKAEISIAHISTPKTVARDISEKTKAMVFDFSSDLGYPGIHFIRINADKAIEGLDKLMSHAPMDLLVMVHREKSFLAGLLNGSLTEKLANDLNFPMLIFKAMPVAEHIA